MANHVRWEDEEQAKAKAKAEAEKAQAEAKAETEKAQAEAKDEAEKAQTEPEKAQASPREGDDPKVYRILPRIPHYKRGSVNQYAYSPGRRRTGPSETSSGSVSSSGSASPAILTPSPTSPFPDKLDWNKTNNGDTQISHEDTPPSHKNGLGEVSPMYKSGASQHKRDNSGSSQPKRESETQTDESVLAGNTLGFGMTSSATDPELVTADVHSVMVPRVEGADKGARVPDKGVVTVTKVVPPELVITVVDEDTSTSPVAMDNSFSSSCSSSSCSDRSGGSSRSDSGAGTQRDVHSRMVHRKGAAPLAPSGRLKGKPVSPMGLKASSLAPSGRPKSSPLTPSGRPKPKAPAKPVMLDGKPRPKRRAPGIPPLVISAGKTTKSDNKKDGSTSMSDSELMQMKGLQQHLHLQQTVIPIPKPVIDVKLVRHEPPRLSHIERAKEKSKTCPARTFTDFQKHMGTNMADLELVNRFNRNELRSSFIDENDPGRDDIVYQALGDVQTLLKHSKNEEENTYSLPQPQCYSDDTIKAVKKITNKYDTLQRMKVNALSFRGGERPRAASAGSSPSTPPIIIIPHPTLEDAISVDEADGISGSSSGTTKKDISRIEMFYRSHGTEVVVCHCLADLAVGPKNYPEPKSLPQLHTGVPVLVLNTGEGKRQRDLLLILAERETGFPLWKERINYLTHYKETHPGLHTLSLSSCLSKMAALHMFCPAAGGQFIARYHQMTSDPNDDLWKVSSSTVKRKKSKRDKSRRAPCKQDISRPCNFIHVTKIDPTDEQFLTCFADFLHRGNSPARSSPALSRTRHESE